MASPTPAETAPLPTDGQKRYSAPEKRLAVAAYRRYGSAVARQQLTALWGAGPTARTLREWHYGELFEPAEEDVEHWIELEVKRKTRLQAQIEQRMEPTLAAYDKFVADGSSLKMQQGAVAIGILYDKLVPPVSKGGGLVNVNAGEGATVQMLVVAPAEIEGAKHVAAGGTG